MTASTRAGTLRSLYRSLSPGRRRDLLVTAAAMLLGTLAELLTIGSLLTFLQILSQPESAGAALGVTWLQASGGTNESKDVVVVATILLVGAAIFSGAARLFILWTTQRSVQRLGHELAVGIFSRMLRQPYSFYVSRNPSELFSSVEKVQSITFGALLPLVQGSVASVIALAIIAMLFAIDPGTALAAALSIGLLYAVVSVTSSRRLKRNGAIISQAATARMKAIQEGLGGIRDILLGHSQPRFEEHYRRVDSRYREAQSLNMFIAAAPRFVVEAAGIIVIGLLALYLSFQPGGLVAALPTLGALALGAQRLLPLLQQAYSGWSNFAGNAALLGDVIELVQAPVSDEDAGLVTDDLPFREEIVFDRVTLSYEGRPDALAGISFRIPKGARVGIMGPSGSGKSSLLDVLMALLEPSSGEVRIDGKPLTNNNRAAWQRHVAHVPQSVYLPDSSIAECIAFGEPGLGLDQPRIEKAARQAQLHDFIQSLPLGYATEVGERGVRLSGGQRQRIAIARALYKQASLLIFDEATGALDQQTEMDVMESIECLGREMTVLVVSHRLSALRACEPIVLIEAGKVSGIRSYRELLGEGRA